MDFFDLPEIDAMSHPLIRSWAGALVALGLLLVSQHALPLAAAAQQTLPGAWTEALLQGVVVHESTGQPVESATVSLVGTDIETQTGRYGGFAFPAVQLGVMSVRVTAPGHPGVVQEVEVKDDGVVFVQFRLPSVAAVLSELLVGVHRDRSGKADPLTAADMLALQVSSARVTPSNIGKNDYPIRLRGTNTFTQSGEPLIFINGVMLSRTEGAFDALSQIPASDVKDIEILRGPAATIRYPMAANGVVVVSTRSGSGR